MLPVAGQTICVLLRWLRTETPFWSKYRSMPDVMLSDAVATSGACRSTPAGSSTSDAVTRALPTLMSAQGKLLLGPEPPLAEPLLSGGSTLRESSSVRDRAAPVGAPGSQYQPEAFCSWFVPKSSTTSGRPASSSVVT